MYVYLNRSAPFVDAKKCSAFTVSESSHDHTMLLSNCAVQVFKICSFHNVLAKGVPFSSFSSVHTMPFSNRAGGDAFKFHRF